MQLKTPKNVNYCATVVEITNLVALDNCDNVCATHIMGNQVIIGIGTATGTIGLFFPVETQLSKEYLSANNLYRKPELNADPEKKGYFEENGRIRCVKFRGNKSEGLFMPLDSLEFSGWGSVEDYIPENFPWVVGVDFDEFNEIEICRKYIPKNIKTPGSGNKTKKDKAVKESKLVGNQFRFHQDTSMLYKNVHRINPNDLISVTYKLHGTSGISSRILCKKPLTWYEKILKKIGVNIVDSGYSDIYSSRKVIKNPELNPNANHFYDVDIWGKAHLILKPLLQDGITLYYEIVGYLPSGAMIQKGFDYGYSPTKEGDPFGIYIYRITYTNPSGKVFEFSAKQVQDWCKANGLNAVPELFYGRARDLWEFEGKGKTPSDIAWESQLLGLIKDMFNEKDCFMCQNKVPEEGVVVRIEQNDLEAFKCKSARFYERETKQLDKGEVDIETEN